MQETRRQLFKTSILSALGLMSAGALTACGDIPKENSENRRPMLPPPTSQDPTVPTLVYSSGDHNWYIFTAVPISTIPNQTYKVQRTSASLTVPTDSSSQQLDTATWVGRQTKNLVTGPFSITNSYINGGIKMDLESDKNGILTSDSAGVFYGFATGTSSSHAAAAWNEIGKQ